MTLRIRIENGTLNCEFTEMEKPNKNEFIDNIWCKSGECPAYFKWVREFESSFQPITLSEEANKWIDENYIQLREYWHQPLSYELSGKETECFEVKETTVFDDEMQQQYKWIYTLHLKSTDGVKEMNTFFNGLNKITH